MQLARLVNLPPGALCSRDTSFPISDSCCSRASEARVYPEVYDWNDSRRDQAWCGIRQMTIHVGDRVEVRRKEEILATLDENGRLDGLPLMPQMLKYCGQS